MFRDNSKMRERLKSGYLITFINIIGTTETLLIQKLTPSSSSTSSSLTSLRRQTPIILSCKPVMQGLNTLRPLALRKTIRGRHLEECRGCFNEPLRLNTGSTMHVFLGGQDKSVIDNMFRWLPEQCGARMHVDRCTFNKGLISLLGILAGCISEESCTQCLTYLGCVSTTGNDPVMIPVHDTKQLLANVLGTANLPRLNEVLKAPGIAELGVFPSIVYVQQC